MRSQKPKIVLPEPNKESGFTLPLFGSCNLTTSIFRPKTENRVGLDTAAIIQLLGFPLPGNLHVGERYDSCGQDFGPGGSRDLYLFGSGSSGQRKAEQRAGADVLDMSR